MKKIFAVALGCLVSVSALFAGCAGNKKEDPATLTVQPSSVELFVGEEKTLTVTTNYADEVVFSSAAPSVAEVNDSGVISGICVGQTSVSVSVRDVSRTITVTVTEKQEEEDPLSGKIVGENVVYTFTVPSAGLYAFEILAETEGEVSALADDVTFAFDGGYSTRLKSRKAEGGAISVGTKYMKSGEHELVITKGAAVLPQSELTLSPANSYNDEGLSLAKTWMDILYQETGYNTQLPNYVGYVETRGWEDIWTHCQYLPYSMYIAKAEQNDEYDRRVRTIADELLIGKMLRDDGSVYTIYRANSDVYQVSIEPDMPRDKYELWRGNAAFAEEMINCYLYTKDDSYLDYARMALDYILEHWSTTIVSGLFGSFYSRYTGSAGGAIDIMSTGRAVMVLAQMYHVTGESKYLDAAKAQGKILLKAQETSYPQIEGLFASAVYANGAVDEFRHGNAYANAMLGLAWLYKTTGEAQYLEAIDKGIRVLDTVYDDELGMIVVMNGTLMPDNPSTGPMYMAGRIGQAVMTCAAFVGKEEYYRQGERVLEFAMGRNYGNRDMINEENGWYYYSVEYTGESNVETSCEIYLAQIQYYYLTQIWGETLL